MEKPALEQYCQFLDENKERYGLVSYEFVTDKVIVFYFKKGHERNVDFLFGTKLKPESITGGRTETVDE
ncbi:hypothetical protein [Acinetobacter lactucae]|uniref:hypothetical protein n=1 Tax=Acinetobacter lactucae TaxID=1785128 RepID=UPI001580A536|nr:hypothetical protein [Acinetobacter lactucae]NUG49669.1 hypothetical protein [Acinetobacter lactucae]